MGWLRQGKCVPPLWQNASNVTTNWIRFQNWFWFTIYGRDQETRIQLINSAITYEISFMCALSSRGVVVVLGVGKFSRSLSPSSSSLVRKYVGVRSQEKESLKWNDRVSAYDITKKICANVWYCRLANSFLRRCRPICCCCIEIRRPLEEAKQQIQYISLL